MHYLFSHPECYDDYGVIVHIQQLDDYSFVYNTDKGRMVETKNYYELGDNVWKKICE